MNSIIHGPWGGSEGDGWVWMPKGIIKKITIIHGEVIDGIKFLSDDTRGGTDVESSYFGVFCHSRSKDTIYIDHPNEYLTSISGMFDEHGEEDVIVITSLRFGTNQKSYGPYGQGTTGTCFSYDGKGGVIVGFHGRAKSYLNALGVYVMPESLAFARFSTSEHYSMHEPCSSCISRMVTPREVGPWGASTGRQWDDGVFSTVKQVYVFMDESLKVLRSIQFLYVKRDAKFCLSSMHGGICRYKMELVSVVNLDGTDEYLTRISGFYGPVAGYDELEAITSITFHTNKRKHGPYGEETGAGYTSFSSTTCLGKVVGFHGRKFKGLLTAIGVHMEYF